MKTKLNLVIVVLLSVTACGDKTGVHVTQNINHALQQTVDSLARKALFRDSLINCYAIILEGDGRCVALVDRDVASASNPPASPDAIASECILPGNIWQVVSLLVLMKMGYFSSPSYLIPTNQGYLPGRQGRIAYFTDSIISIRKGLQRGGNTYTINYLSYLVALDQGPSVIYHEMMELFPTSSPSLSPRQDYPESLTTMYQVVDGYAYRVYPEDIAWVCHAIISGGKSKRPYIGKPGKDVIVCSKSVADSLLTIMKDSSFMNIPLAKRSSTVYDIDEYDDETSFCQRCFVGSFFKMDDTPTTIFCMTRYRAEVKEESPRPSPAEALFREIAENVLENNSEHEKTVYH